MLRAIQVENEALQRAILSRKAELPASPPQVCSLQQERVEEDSGYSGTRQCLEPCLPRAHDEERELWGAPDLRPISLSTA